MATHDLPGLIPLKLDLNRMPNIDAFRANVHLIAVPVLNTEDPDYCPPAATGPKRFTTLWTIELCVALRQRYTELRIMPAISQRLAAAFASDGNRPLTQSLRDVDAVAFPLLSAEIRAIIHNGISASSLLDRVLVCDLKTAWLHDTA